MRAIIALEDVEFSGDELGKVLSSLQGSHIMKELESRIVARVLEQIEPRLPAEKSTLAVGLTPESQRPLFASVQIQPHVPPPLPMPPTEPMPAFPHTGAQFEGLGPLPAKQEGMHVQPPPAMQSPMASTSGVQSSKKPETSDERRAREAAARTSHPEKD